MSPSVSLTPHPPDLELVATHGLASILAHMSANHGLALGVVEAVYKRVGSLREADEVLKGMREAAAGFGEQEIKRRVRARRGAGRGRKSDVGRGEGSGNGKSHLRYVVASEDGEGSEYSPPEASRAAMWKRQSEEASYTEKESGEEEEEEEAAEGREVEEELRNVDEDDSDSEAHHDFSRHSPFAEGNVEVTGEDEDDYDSMHDAERDRKVTERLLEDTKYAQDLERKMGKGPFRRYIARLFTST